MQVGTSEKFPFHTLSKVKRQPPNITGRMGEGWEIWTHGCMCPSQSHHSLVIVWAIEIHSSIPWGGEWSCEMHTRQEPSKFCSFPLAVIRNRLLKNSVYRVVSGPLIDSWNMTGILQTYFNYWIPCFHIANVIWTACKKEAYRVQ